MLRKSIFEKVGYFDESLKFWQEYELSIRIAQVSNLYYVSHPLIYYRINQHDKERLTNKYFTWKESVKYIHIKHQNLYAKLPINLKIAAKALVWHDAIERCKSSNLPFREVYYRALWNSYRFLRAIVNGRFLNKLNLKNEREEN